MIKLHGKVGGTLAPDSPTPVAYVGGTRIRRRDVDLKAVGPHFTCAVKRGRERNEAWLFRNIDDELNLLPIHRAVQRSIVHQVPGAALAIRLNETQGRARPIAHPTRFHPAGDPNALAGERGVVGDGITTSTRSRETPGHETGQ